jgi:hypothetical protein
MEVGNTGGGGGGFSSTEAASEAAPANLAGTAGVFHVERSTAETDPAKIELQSPKEQSFHVEH